MNKGNNKLIVLVIILLLIGGVAFLLKGKSTQTQNETNPVFSGEKKDKETVSDIKTLSGNIFDLLKSEESLVCTFSTNTEDVVMAGTSYISGKKMRVDTASNMTGQGEIESHMISDGTWVYSWTSATPQGFKMNIEEAQKSVEEVEETADTEKDNTQIDNFNQDYEYKCSKWSVDQSKFEIPTNITFTDFSQMMAPVQNSACSACDSVQDSSAKEQCKTAMNCQ